MQKTVVVAVENGTDSTRSTGATSAAPRKFKAHDEENACQVGDVVGSPSRGRSSKEKHWLVREIVKETIGRASKCWPRKKRRPGDQCRESRS